MTHYESFRVGIRHFAHGIIMDLIGDVTKEAESALLREESRENGGVPRFIVLNFTDAPYVNSAGIAILIRMARTAAKANAHTFAYGVTPHFQKLFRMVGLTRHLMIYPDEYSVLTRIESLLEENRQEPAADE